MRAAVIVPAGGSGVRMGGTRKQYLELAGEPVLLRALRPFLEHPQVEWGVVALPAEDVAKPPFRLPQQVVVVRGGRERGDSVRAALAAVPPEADAVLIHDAARPLVTRALVDRVLEAVRPGQGAIAAIPVSDTLKKVASDGSITGTVDRAGFWQAQTPQGFPLEMIASAYRRAAEDSFAATDDAALVERYGGRVVVVEGDVRNLKITRAQDLQMALSILELQ